MTPQKLVALVLAADQAADAVANLLQEIGNPPVLSPLDAVRVLANNSAVHLTRAVASIAALQCGRLPCDRNGGICPRCFPEVIG